MNDKYGELFIMPHGGERFGKVNGEQNGGKESGRQFKRAGLKEKATF